MVPRHRDQPHGDGVRLPLTCAAARDYVRDVAPKGILLHYNFFPECRTDNVIVDGTPVTTGCIISSSGTVQQEAEFDIVQQSARYTGNAPFFIAIEFTAWNAMPSDVEAVAKTLDPSKYVVVRADHYFDLLRRANGLASVAGRCSSSK